MELNILQKQWLAALRSGEYKQGKGYLRRKTEEFCCLGVLCDINDKSKWSTHLDRYNYLYDGYATSSISTVLADLTCIDKITITLVDLNDGDGKTFAEIADFLEKYWAELAPHKFHKV